MRKKYRNMYLTLSSFLLSYLLFFPMNVFAEGTSDAVADIMNNERFAGAISSIEWLTTRIDYWFTMAITAAGFFIISASLLKNACAGAYCSNHKFWDKVAEAHEKSESIQLSQLFGGGIKDKFMNISTSGIKDAILCIIPNIKAFTDFDDADIEPKQYFIKAIPQMLGCIMIGVFIYNGYYRDTAATVGNFGSEICSRVFSSVDPAAWVDKLTQTTGTPPCIYKNDQTLEGKALYEVSTALYRAYLSISTGITSMEDKTNLMRDCENMATQVLKATGESGGKASSIESKFFSDERVYDFTIGNLKIIPGVTQGANQKTTITAIDKETGSEYSITGYQTFDSDIVKSNKIPSDKSTFHYAFTMKGSQKTNTTGLTTLRATAGNWSIHYATATTITMAPDKYEINGSGLRTVRKSGFTSAIVSNANVKKAAAAVFFDTFTDVPKNATLTFEDGKVSKYPGQGDTFEDSKVSVENDYVYTSAVRFTVKYTASGQEAKTLPVVVPVNVKFHHN